VEEIRHAYGILNKDTYNFDKIGFVIGITTTLKVITSSNIIGRVVVVQPGNRK
jgi:hypothetical protein